MNSTQSLTDLTRTSFTNSNTVSYPNDTAILHMNAGYREGIKALLKKAPKMFWTWGNTNSVIGQSEYTMETFTFPDATTRDVTSVDMVSVKYDDKFVQLEKKDFHSLEDDIENYAEYKGEPFYFQRDNSIFIFPTPTTTVTDGVKIYGNYRPLDLTMSSDDNQIKTPKLSNVYLAYYQAYMYWTGALNENRASYYLAQFESELEQMCQTIQARDNEPVSRKIPNSKY